MSLTVPHTHIRTLSEKKNKKQQERDGLLADVLFAFASFIVCLGEKDNASGLINGRRCQLLLSFFVSPQTHTLEKTHTRKHGQVYAYKESEVHS